MQEPKSEGLSVQTLMIAALASGAAAVVVSHFWDKGTILASAMTPVIVAIVSEGLRKPVQSERVRSGVRNVSSVARPASFNRPRSGRTPTVMAPPAPGVDEGLQQREDGVEAGPVRVYSSGSNKRPPSPDGSGPGRRLKLKHAVITGLVAFLIAAAALTLPELIFGGSVTGGRSTTYFGGGSSTSEKGESQDGGSNDGKADDPTKQDPDSTAPSDSGSSDGSSGDSGSDQPESTSPETAPAPQDTAPAPTPAPAPAPAPVPSP